MRSVQGRVAVVTGGGGGLGRAVALALARRGCALALVDRDGAALERVAAEVGGVSISTHVVDVTDHEALAAMVAEVRARHGAAHLVVAAAGLAAAGTLVDLPAEDLERVLRVNVLGVALTVRAVLPLLLDAGEGRVVLISSMLGYLGMPGQTAYCASKFAVRGFAESLRPELAGTGVGVTTVFPGAVRTGIMRSARFAAGEDKAWFVDWLDRKGLDPEQVGERIVAAAERGRSELVIGTDGHAAVIAGKWAPRLAGWVLGREFRKRRP